MGFLLFGGHNTASTAWEGRLWATEFLILYQESKRGQKRSSLWSSWLSETYPASSHTLTLRNIPTSSFFLAYFSWFLGPHLSLLTEERGSNAGGTHTWAYTRCHLCEFWQVALLLNLWGLYYIMLHYFILCYVTIYIYSSEDKEITQVRLLALFLAYCKHLWMTQILSV